ncbi:uncharacterized protein OCT59_027388 [Rhizophagus irregularis]|uniref:F-box domain-containing protein n=4 Tax=Rhizophagus irregularis TaxID=588596 RepID=A0A916E2T9_9GLOM|nr:hypothetical protein GLOIN_2v1587307 [Rhizophagus irregularis DAOM 181602=DAOM 197198]UZO07085.1 hypothetical protein OCT59_027388 [Rhizophagus irregularis]POG73364.1 hypothetical protein GLOIN_2v1587307 [Rhizophagus irregularis DAOM 181602=DAOM 197198]CAB4478388.1 unnamed protein product [Rhizophagus irregularis]CAB5200341.1 unnamed protein product [Rhizophagus irregularis]CAB5357603.1 unnamed protein product [Rhizophagus irregularis]|eukprot:XP_025180230.1 hypothetical protein GLOIN_2v1587307 [Rhizophagus irregularis DAOM 181602=DAOM 197198]
MVQSLPAESLQEIFKSFKDDIKILHSCLLVNKFWASCAVSFLWSRPFELLTRPSSKLIETYSKFFDKDSQKILSSYGIIIIPPQKPTLFEYPLFIKSLQYDYLYDFSSVWFQEGFNKGIQKRYAGFEKTSILRVFVKELFKLMFSKFSSIEDLSFNVIRFLDAPDIAGSRLVSRFRPYRDASYVKRALEYLSLFEEDIIEILSFEDSKISLKRLQTLECGANRNDIVILDTFRNLTRSINTLKFNFASELSNHNVYDDANIICSITNLIKEQRYIKKVSIRHGTQHVFGLVTALECHVNNLTELSFDKIDFNIIPTAEKIFSIISLCENLKKLVVTNCEGITNEIILPLGNATFINLETLIFTKTHNPIDDIFRAFLIGVPRQNNITPLTLEPLKNLISTNGNLKVLRLGRNLLYSRDLPNDFVFSTTYPPVDVMESATSCCRNLTLIEIHIRREILPQVLKVLESNCQLNRLIFSAEMELVDDERFWRKLSTSLPISLKDLTISIGPVFWLMVLHWLFENMKCKLEILQFPLSIFIDDEYLCIITQYAKLMGSLKRLALHNSNRITQKGLSKALLVIETITNTGEYNY